MYPSTRASSIHKVYKDCPLLSHTQEAHPFPLSLSLSDKTMNSFTLARLDNKQKLGIFSNSDEERESWVNAITDCMSANLTALRAGGVVPYSNEV